MWGQMQIGGKGGKEGGGLNDCSIRENSFRTKKGPSGLQRKPYCGAVSSSYEDPKKKRLQKSTRISDQRKFGLGEGSKKIASAWMGKDHAGLEKS